jgi:hypothetical protein
MGLIPSWTANDVVELVKKGATIEAQEKILELREAALRLQEENLELNERIKELEEKLSVKENLTYKAPYYWLEKPEGKDGPFCQHCQDKHFKLIRLQATRFKGQWRCEACQKKFYDKNFGD